MARDVLAAIEAAGIEVATTTYRIVGPALPAPASARRAAATDPTA
jgi:hypothetical protein